MFAWTKTGEHGKEKKFTIHEITLLELLSLVGKGLITFITPVSRKKDILQKQQHSMAKKYKSHRISFCFVSSVNGQTHRKNVHLKHKIAAVRSSVSG